MFNISCAMSLLFVMDSALELGVDYFIYVFHIKLIIFLESAAFMHIATCTKQELYVRIKATSHRYLLQNVGIQLLRTLRFVIVCFSLEAILQGMSKIIQPKAKQCQNSSEAETYCRLKIYG